jgi:flagellar basal body-associated protein FliL
MDPTNLAYIIWIIIFIIGVIVGRFSMAMQYAWMTKKVDEKKAKKRKKKH